MKDYLDIRNSILGYARNYKETNPDNTEQLNQIMADIKAIQVQARVSPKVADEDKGLGKCMEKNCNKFATTDYNGHKHYVCKYHYEKLTREFEEDYD